MRRLLGLGLAFSLLVVWPGTALAVGLDQIVALTKAGVSEPIILALIDRDKTVFAIEPEQLVKLQRDGVSETVILAMLKSGRAEGDAQTRADSAQNAAMILSSLSTVPEVVLLGHDPEWPNAVRGFSSSPPPVGLLPMPYGFPYAVPYASDYGPRHRPRRPSVSRPSPTQTSPALCITHPSTGPVPPAVGSMGYVTVCPPGK
jgi:hypothetical protein